MKHDLKVYDCHNTNTIFNTKKYYLKEDVDKFLQTIVQQPLSGSEAERKSCQTCVDYDHCLKNSNTSIEACGDWYPKKA